MVSFAARGLRKVLSALSKEYSFASPDGVGCGRIGR